MKKLSFVDKYLTLWIFLAMAVGIALGALFPSLPSQMELVSYGQTNLALALGLILMMYPPLARVDYAKLPGVFRNLKVLGLSVVLNWILGPLLMFGLAALFLQGKPDLMSGLILIGLARCIAMVLVWNHLADGSPEYGAGLVALNSLFQIVAYAPLAFLFLTYLPETFGLPSFQVDITMGEIALSVAIYLGIPFLAGFLSRMVLVSRKGLVWYEESFLPAIGPITLIALLFTIVLMFSLKGKQILTLPLDVVQVSIPLMLYFICMFFLAFFAGRLLKARYPENAALSFTAAGNNFELAIAVAISVFGLNSGQAFAAVLGPLIEVPALVLLVQVSRWMHRRLYPNENGTAPA
ncbi:MAG: arsenical-resistance protein [Spirochaetaceae bacterium]|nr:arsenical-resistance protein [Spirochaetaceae bacterium]|tara:strand:- start:15335 stop:16387 length:1053 start_codon:yes stop_codon:yes gene_type:complete